MYEYSRGFPGKGPQTTMGLSKTAIFTDSAIVSWEPSEIRPTLLYSDIESIVGFPLTPKYVTFNDLECHFYVKFCFRAGTVCLEFFVLCRLCVCRLCVCVCLSVRDVEVP